MLRMEPVLVCTQTTVQIPRPQELFVFFKLLLVLLDDMLQIAEVKFIFIKYILTTLIHLLKIS